MRELLEVVSDAVSRTGVNTSMHIGSFPSLSEPTAYVVVPHEFFMLTAPEHQPTDEQLKRTIGFCVEHPGNATFEVSASRGARLGALFDINADSTDELRRRGLSVERFRLGYSPQWDAWGGDSTSLRPTDITYMGTTDARRDQLLALQAEALSRWDCRILLPPHEQMTQPRPDFLMGSEKLRHLAQSKVLLNLHRGASRALEWVRILEAMCNGCLVVSERSTDFDPLTPGENILFARASVAVSVAEGLLRDPARLAKMRHEAYAACRAMHMEASAAQLAEVAEALSRGDSLPRVPDRPPISTPPPPYPVVAEPPPPASGLPQLAWWARALPKELRLAQASLVEESIRVLRPRIVVGASKRQADARIAAIVVDGSGSAAAVQATIRSLEPEKSGVDVVVIGADDPRGVASVVGVPHGRFLNRAFDEINSELVLVIEAGQALFPGGLSRLSNAISRASDGNTCLAYGIMADEVNGVLWNCLPLEAERLAGRAYVSCPFVLRRVGSLAAGPFSEDPALLGYEYYEFIYRLVAGGARAAFVQEIVGRGQPWMPPQLSVSNLVPERVWNALGRPSLRPPP